MAPRGLFIARVFMPVIIATGDMLFGAPEEASENAWPLVTVFHYEIVMTAAAVGLLLP